MGGRLVFTLSFVLASSAMAQNPRQIPIDPLKQKATLKIEKSEFGSADFKVWQSLCPKIAQKLLSTPSQLGFLSAFQCLDQNSHQTNRYPWIIELSRYGDNIDLTIRYMPKQGKKFETGVMIRFQSATLDQLDKPAFIDALTQIISELSPLGVSYTHQGKSPAVNLGQLNKPQGQNQQSVLYTLQYDKEKGAWLPKIRASLKTAANEPSQLGLQSQFLPLRKGRSYWLHSTTPFVEQIPRYEGLLNAKILDPSERLRTIASTAHFLSMQMGLYMQKDDSILEKSILGSISTEFRRGFFRGFRLSYEDLSPASDTRLEEKTDFRFSRTLLGWAYTIHMPEPVHLFVSKINLQPKLGLTDVRAEFQELNQELAEPVSFEVKRAPYTAFELDLESENSLFRLRLWASINKTILGLAEKKGMTVRSRKVGGQLFFDLWHWQDRRMLKLYAFTQAEELSFQKNRDPSKKTVTELELGMWHSGLGLAYTW